MLTLVDLEERVPRDHPLQWIQAVADAAWRGYCRSSTACMPVRNGFGARNSTVQSEDATFILHPLQAVIH